MEKCNFLSIVISFVRNISLLTFTYLLQSWYRWIGDKNCSTKISFTTKLDITYDKSLAQLLMFMHILKEKIIFITTSKQEYTEINTLPYLTTRFPSLLPR